MSDQPTRSEMAYAALFHDIGKFGQRTGRTSPNTDLENRYCPSYKHRYTHRHVLYTEQFIRENASVFPSTARPHVIAPIAAGHHKPDSLYQDIVRLADWASSGMDRLGGGESTQGVYYDVSLRSVFDNVGTAERGAHRYFLGPLDADHWNPTDSAKAGRDAYAETYDRFVEDFTRLEGLDEDRFDAALDAVLERYLWGIPSSTRDADDVSLYDHVRTTAAFAVVLYQFVATSDRDSRRALIDLLEKSTRPFLLISGDISGIQRYLFDIRSHQHSSRVLRARSFELQLLTAQAVRLILSRLGLPRWCRLFSSAGRFLVVVPNTAETTATIADLRVEIDAQLLTQYAGRISLNISHGVPASIKDMEQQTAGQVFDEIRLDVQNAKQRKLQAGLNEVGHILDSIADSQNGVCISCGIRPATGEEGLCSHCDNLQSEGRTLPKAQTVTVPMKSETLRPKLLFDQVGSTEGRSELFTVNTYRAGIGLIRSQLHVPMDEYGTVWDFRRVAEEAEGVKHLALLKADVDNLGWLFSAGLGARRSFSRFATASRNLDLFFSTAVGDLLRSRAAFENIYTVFSGGDDLCMIGPWNVMFDFAVALNEWFHTWVGVGNPVTLSVGLTLEHPHTPVAAMAERGESALARSKNSGRDRATAFGVTVRWPDLEQAIEDGKWLAGAIEDEDKPSRGAVYRLLSFADKKRESATLTTRANMESLTTWRSAFRYHVARNWPEESVDRVVTLVETNYNSIPIALNYALHKTRNVGGERE